MNKTQDTTMIEIEMLGCGATYGVPIVGGQWGKCDPENSKNSRTRSSIAIKRGDQSIVIDAGPEFRLQTTRAGLNPDTLLITHGHWDHIAGLGELTYYIEESLQRDLHIYADATGMRFIRGMFGYLFNDKYVLKGNLFTPVGEDDEYKIIWHEFEPYKPLMIKGIEIMPFLQDHDVFDTIGFRIGDFAYSTDLKDFPEQSHPFLKNLHSWILDCDYWEPSESHGDPEGVVRLINQFGPKRVYLTHMDEKMDYRLVTEWFRDRGHNNVIPGHDGLKFSVSLD